MLALRPSIPGSAPEIYLTTAPAILTTTASLMVVVPWSILSGLCPPCCLVLVSAKVFSFYRFPRCPLRYPLAYVRACCAESCAKVASALS